MKKKRGKLLKLMKHASMFVEWSFDMKGEGYLSISLPSSSICPKVRHEQGPSP